MGVAAGTVSEFLTGLSSTLQVDSYAGFNALSKSGHNSCGVVIALKLVVLKGRIFSARYLRRFTMKNRRYSGMQILAIL
jgi:hypothetical protein